MQNVQRTFGKFGKRTADEGQISLLLKDFDDADQLLAKLIEESKRWNESWLSILMHQQRLFSEFEALYAPIIGAGDEHQGHVAVETPEHIFARTVRMKTESEELKNDLKDVLEKVEQMLIKPAQSAKDDLHIMKKTIKKREDKKLDFERYQSRVDSLMKKKVRSDRENMTLAKAEKDLSLATDQYQAADEHLRNVLPHVLQAVYSLQPHLLAAQVQIQNTLLGHYYTSFHNYCTQEGFPSPAPPMEEVVRLWEEVSKPVQRETESIAILANSKSVRSRPENSGGPTNGYRRPSQQSQSRTHSVSPARAPDAVRPKITSSASTTSLLSAPLGTPSESVSTPSPQYSGYSAQPASNADYFSRDRQSSNNHALSAHSSATALAGMIAAKKKPPPPPPPRLNSHQYQYVTALYDFGGQSEGDLVFKEGDKIRVIKKTESTDDWWQGELKGVKGMFPANYCSR